MENLLRIKREFLKPNDILVFNQGNNRVVTRWFDPTSFPIEENQHLLICLDHSLGDDEGIIRMDLIYVDTIVKPTLYGYPEYSLSYTIRLPRGGFQKNSEVEIPFENNYGLRQLQRFVFSHHAAKRGMKIYTSVDMAINKQVVPCVI